MCRASTEPGGPKRCSGDTRSAYRRALQDVKRLERQARDVVGRTRRRPDNAGLHAALRGAVLSKTDTDPDELDREVAEALAQPSPPAAGAPALKPTPAFTHRPPQPHAACFFCDRVIAADAAAHVTRYGKICCHECWPDIRLTQGPGGGLA